MHIAAPAIAMMRRSRSERRRTRRARGFAGRGLAIVSAEGTRDGGTGCGISSPWNRVQQAAFLLCADALPHGKAARAWEISGLHARWSGWKHLPCKLLHI